MSTKNKLTEPEKELVSLIINECKTTGDIHSKLKQLFAGTVEQILEAEMEEHLGYEKHSIEAFYNSVRPHSGIAWLAPNSFESLLLTGLNSQFRNTA